MVGSAVAIRALVLVGRPVAIFNGGMVAALPPDSAGVVVTVVPAMRTAAQRTAGHSVVRGDSGGRRGAGEAPHAAASRAPCAR